MFIHVKDSFILKICIEKNTEKGVLSKSFSFNIASNKNSVCFINERKIFVLSSLIIN